jgi:hypothetical protein
VLAVSAGGEQERDGGEHGHAAQDPRDYVGGTQARGVGDEAAGQGRGPGDGTVRLRLRPV